ncbi:hypothetical protein JIG36_35745 [Actinoplanes sp. LDG1-06]|uniref:Nuclear transport factor 2 family protein n=1 Tax=Paractinoplanes ovalisporus TaxID=2810368 RepID=A0ABS2AM62_9ACTN|nr:hypothetical protein [Actinoplanes ovalisporus]MBM2620868.1 hypothetical protein [Actinoplanes ovalisporus]
MNEATLRPYVEAHVDALKSNDVAALTEDFAADLRPQLPAVIASLPTPLPLTDAEILSIEAGDEVSVVHNRLVGGDGNAFTMRSEWRLLDGRPRITAGAPA